MVCDGNVVLVCLWCTSKLCFNGVHPFFVCGGGITMACVMFFFPWCCCILFRCCVCCDVVCGMCLLLWSVLPFLVCWRCVVSGFNWWRFVGDIAVNMRCEFGCLVGFVFLCLHDVVFWNLLSLCVVWYGMIGVIGVWMC